MLLESFFTVRGHIDGVPFFLQSLAYKICNLRFIFNKKYLHITDVYYKTFSYKNPSFLIKWAHVAPSTGRSPMEPPPLAQECCAWRFAPCAGAQRPLYRQSRQSSPAHRFAPYRANVPPRQGWSPPPSASAGRGDDPHSTCFAVSTLADSHASCALSSGSASAFDGLARICSTVHVFTSYVLRSCSDCSPSYTIHCS